MDGCIIAVTKSKGKQRVIKTIQVGSPPVPKDKFRSKGLLGGINVPIVIE